MTSICWFVVNVCGLIVVCVVVVVVYSFRVFVRLTGCVYGFGGFEVFPC